MGDLGPSLPLARRRPLTAPTAPPGAVLSLLPPESRFSFRGDTEAARAAGEAFGAALPATPCCAAVAGERAALWLGPDEWLLIAPVGEGVEIAAAIGRVLAGQAHALVDIGHRDAGIGLAGTLAPVLLGLGCPLDLDLSAFPVDHCTRTVFSKAGIVLWRTEAMRFRIDVARSFAAYVWRLLEEAGRENRI